MQHITKQELESLTHALKKEKTSLEAELEEHGKRVGGDWQGTSRGFESKESDEMDTADAIEELATNVPLVETLERQLKDVVDALEKIENGTYGTDEITGEPIPIARLRANPAARTNVE